MTAATEPTRTSPAPDAPAASANGTGALDHLREASRALHSLVALEVELVAARVRRALLRVALAVAAGLFLLSLAVGAAVHLTIGVAGALGDLLGSSWSGHLAAGVLVLLLLGGGVALILGRRRSAAHRRIAARFGPRTGAGP